MSYRSFVVGSLSLVLLSFMGREGRAAALYEPTLLDGKTYTESWTAVTRLQNGSFLHTSFMISNAGLANGKGLCRAKIADAAGHTSNREIVVERAGWHADPNQGLRIGACSVATKGDQTVIDMPFSEGAIQVTFSGVPKPTPMPARTLEANGHFYRSEVLLPFAPTKVSLNGSTVSGDSFFDHNRSNALPTDIAYGWVRFRGFAPNCGRLVLARYVKRAEGAAPAQMEVSIWKEGSPGPVELKAPSAPLPSLDTAPAELKVAFYDGAQRVSRVQGSRLLLKEAPFEEHGMMGRLVGAFVGSVRMATFDAVLEDAAEGACGKVPGILEVDHFGD